jgi:hypothetical protein
MQEILSGIGAGYRLYPVRAGETIDDIISKRRITLDEMSALNPGVKLEKLAGRQAARRMDSYRILSSHGLGRRRAAAVYALCLD